MKDKDQALIYDLKSTGQFDVHKWSDYPEIKVVTDMLFEEVVSYRKATNPKARIREPESIKKHLRVLLLNLYIASQSHNPWIGVSKNKTDYQQNSRYRKIFLTYDFLVPLIDNLISMGYVEQHLGFHDPKTGIGFSTRIRATPKLMQRMYEPDFGLNEVEEKVGLVNLVTENPEAEQETIILRNANKENVEYEDTEVTCRMREKLRLINSRLLESRITLEIDDDQYVELEKQLKSKRARLLGRDNREHVDFTRKTLCRVFNEDFQHGGRFYGGWWLGLPKKYRNYIEINRKPTVEVDFSAHHIRMLYARDGLIPPDDPYEIEDCPFTRDDLKTAFLVLINASGRETTIKACGKQGVKQADEILAFLEIHHKPIAHYFYTGMGLTLQFEDSMLAEEIMLRMLERGATVLPVHDSFIVRNSYEDELKTVMEEVFTEMYKAKPAMKTKQTVLDKQGIEEDWENQPIQVTTDDLEELLNNQQRFKNYYKLWGKS